MGRSRDRNLEGGMSADVAARLAPVQEPTPATQAVWARAEADLLIPVDGGKPDPTLWEHAVRVACLALHISCLAELADQRIDRSALVAASLYHDAGWVVQVRRKEIARMEICSRPTSDAQRELAASLLENSLAAALGKPSLDLAVRVVRECGRKTSEHPEAHLIAEAENLDQIGPQAICLNMRRHAAEARGIDAMLEAWQRQQEYHYWEARLHECFRFDATRRLAQERLAAVARFMTDLRRAHRLEDAADFFGRT